jgi:hypothetical protein
VPGRVSGARPPGERAGGQAGGIAACCLFLVGQTFLSPLKRRRDIPVASTVVAFYDGDPTKNANAEEGRDRSVPATGGHGRVRLQIQFLAGAPSQQCSARCVFGFLGVLCVLAAQFS